MRRSSTAQKNASGKRKGAALRLHHVNDTPQPSAIELALLDSTLAAERERGSDAIRAFFTNSADALFVAAIDANEKLYLEDFNPAFARLLKVPPPASQGRQPHQFLPLDIAQAFTDALERCRGAAAPTRFDIDAAGEHGIERWEFLLTPVRGFLGRFDRITGHGRVRHDARPGDDIESRQLLNCIARTTRDVLYVFDRTTERRLYLNARAQDVIGYRPEQIADMPRESLRRLIHPDDLPKVIAHYRRLSALGAGKIMSVEYRIRHASGDYVWLASKDTVVASDRNGHATKIVGCATDMTDQRHALADIKKISRRLLRTQDEERRRIARELHDSTAQHLVAVGIGLARLGMIREHQHGARLDRGDVQEVLAEMRKGIAEAQREIRGLSYLLHPPALEKAGLCQTLRQFAAGFARRTRINVDLTIQDDFVCRSHDIATALLRIAQEALINVYRHADASRVAMRLTSRGGELTLEIEDDGKGIGPAVIAADDDIESIGVGIPGMRARVRQFRGDLEVRRGGRGALIRATIPERASSLD